MFIFVRESDGFIWMITESPAPDQFPALEGYTTIEVSAAPPGPINEFKWDFTENKYVESNKRPSSYHYWNGQKWVDPRVPVPAPAVTPTVEQARSQMYPSVENQLDMLWHAMDTDQMPKVEPFYSTIKQVKLANPKLPAEKVWSVGKN